jgi:predicted metal-binding membrane protein
MRNIFELTKREQRIVVVIVMVLVAFAFAKHFWQRTTQPAWTKLKPAPAATSATDHNEDESTNGSGD